MSNVCNAGKKYGLTVRVPGEIDLRRIPAVPRATKKFERLYKSRTAVERVNARLNIFWGAVTGYNATGSHSRLACAFVLSDCAIVSLTRLMIALKNKGKAGTVFPSGRFVLAAYSTLPEVCARFISLGSYNV